ncbi:MAG: type II secretion system F family protein [bacterium]|nr:type II secretion system F family protein [bacterium]
MPTYMYQAQTRDGKLINSKIESPNLNMAIDTLTASRLKILDISPEKFDPLSIFGALHVLKKESVVTLTRRMTTMIKSGLAIDRSLSVMQEQEEDPKLKAILAQVLHDVRVGGSLSWSMAKHPVAFDGLYVSMIKVGEATGDLGELMDRLADFLERDLAVRQKAKSAMTYPLFVLVVCFLVMCIIFFYVMPPMLDTFSQMTAGMVLPLPTRIMFFITDLIKSPFLYLGIALVFVWYFFFVRVYLDSPSGKMQFDRIKLRLPIFGDLFRKLLVAQFCRTLGTLLTTGTPLVRSLEILGDFSDNDYFKASVIRPMIDGISEGQNMSVLLQETNFFPRMVENMVAVGETTGEMPRMLNRVSDFYDKEIVYALESMLTMVEPILIGIMGLIVCFVLLSVFLPLYQVIMSMG